MENAENQDQRIAIPEADTVNWDPYLIIIWPEKVNEFTTDKTFLKFPVKNFAVFFADFSQL